MYRANIEGHPVVLDVSAQLRTEIRPDSSQRLPTTDSPAPVIDGLQLGSHQFAAGFNLGQRRTLPGSSPIKGKPQKVEGARPTLIATRCPGPPNLSVCRLDRNLLNRKPLLYPSTGNSQELVFGGHDARQTST
jgi:hypothetical protein